MLERGKCTSRRAQCDLKCLVEHLRIFVFGCRENHPDISQFLYCLPMENGICGQPVRILPPFLHLSPLVVAYSPSSGRGIYEASCFAFFCSERDGPCSEPTASSQPWWQKKKSTVYSQDIKLN